MNWSAATPVVLSMRFIVATVSSIGFGCSAPNYSALIDQDGERALMCPSPTGLVATGGSRLSLGSVETAWQALPSAETEIACACTGRTIEDHQTALALTATYFRCSDTDSPCPNPSRQVGSLSQTTVAAPLSRADYVAESPGCELAPSSELPHCSLSARRSGHVESIRSDADTFHLLVRDCMRYRAFQSWTTATTPSVGSGMDAWPDATACVREAMETAAEFRIRVRITRASH